MTLNLKEIRTTTKKLPKTKIKEILEILDNPKFGTKGKKEIEKIIDQINCD